MAKSQKQIQQELISDGTIDSLAKSKSDFSKTNKLPVIERLMVENAAQFILMAKENLKRKGKISTGAIEDGLSESDLTYSAGTYTISLGYDKTDPAAKYYDYVNKGVRGVGKGGKSPYFFKKVNPSPNHVNAIEAYMKHNNIAAFRDDQTKRLSKLQVKRNSLLSLEASAYLIARATKRKGMKASSFFDDAKEEFYGKGFADAIAAAAGADVRIEIRKFNNENNNGDNAKK